MNYASGLEEKQEKLRSFFFFLFFFDEELLPAIYLEGTVKSALDRKQCSGQNRLWKWPKRLDSKIQSFIFRVVYKL